MSQFSVSIIWGPVIRLGGKFFEPLSHLTGSDMNARLSQVSSLVGGESVLRRAHIKVPGKRTLRWWQLVFGTLRNL